MTKTNAVLRPLIVALGLAFAAPLAVQAYPGAGGEGSHGKQGFHHKRGFSGQGHGRHGGDFTRGLNLTEAQRDKIFELRHAAAPSLRSKGKEVRAARSEMRQVAMTDKFDEGRVIALSNQLAKAEAEFNVTRLRLTNQVYNVLTPEQRKQAADMRNHRIERAKAAAPTTRPAPQIQ
ncbi:MAG TPA: Spy/CpxP family protein refolding chaperone [Burkholderiales bacterium]|nr:Spy/CpxP family protein refolding chaperone [Burkholderiales bacterium]